MRGTIRSRLLVNALVDPDEAAQRLPDGLRPHVTSHGKVVGGCLRTRARMPRLGTVGALA
jgi:hypothetical protein